MDTHPVPRKYKNNSSNGFWNPIQGPNMEFCLLLISRSHRFNSTNCWLCFLCFRLKDYEKVVLAIEIIYYLGMLRMIFARKATRRAAHPGFRFKAYVELATDAAQRWLPPEGELNQWGSFTSTTHWCFQPSAFCGSIVSSDLNWWLFIERNPWTSCMGKYSSQLGDGDTNYGAIGSSSWTIGYHYRICQEGFAKTRCFRWPFQPEE